MPPLHRGPSRGLLRALCASLSGVSREPVYSRVPRKPYRRQCEELPKVWGCGDAPRHLPAVWGARRRPSPQSGVRANIVATLV